MSVVSISMPDGLVDRIDDFVNDHGYSGRSEVLREAARNLLGEFEEETLEGRDLMAVVTVLFNYENTNVEQAMTQLRHDNEELVDSNVHSHVGDGYCMELFILEGRLEDISQFVGQVRATKETLSIDYSVIPVDSVSQTLSEAN